MFKITIEETKEVRKIKPKDWVEGADPKNGQRGYGYAPEVETLVSVTRDVYMQVVENIDLVSVIQAINTRPIEHPKPY